MESATGATEMDNRTAGITVSRPEPAIWVEGSVAVIPVIPVAKPVARPSVEIEAADVFEEDHVTLEVRDLVLRSEYVPVAAYCSVWPTPMESATGATEMDNRTAGITVSRPEPAIWVEGSVAVIPVIPVAMPVARPSVEIDDVVGLDDAHVTVEVRSLVLRSE